MFSLTGELGSSWTIAEIVAGGLKKWLAGKRKGCSTHVDAIFRLI